MQLAAPSLASAYLEPLQAVVYEAEAIASPTPRSRLKVPPLEVIDRCAHECPVRVENGQS